MPEWEADDSPLGVTGFEKTTAQEAGQTSGVADKLDLFGFFPGGDHVPFKEAGVPTVTIVSGGIHPHFHQPTDTADTINPEILQAVARYVHGVGMATRKYTIEQTHVYGQTATGPPVTGLQRNNRRMLKKAAQQGSSERRTEA